VSSSTLVPPTPIIDVPEGVGTRYTPLQAALVYLVVTARIRRTAGVYILAGIIALSFIGQIVVVIGSSPTGAAPPDMLPWSLVYMIVCGLLLLDGLVLIGFAIRMIFASPLASVTASERVQLLCEIELLLILTFLCLAPVQSGILDVHSTELLIVGFCCAAIACGWAFWALRLPRRMREYRLSKRYQVALRERPEPDDTAQANKLLRRLLIPELYRVPDIIEFASSSLLTVRQTYRALMQDDGLILGTVVGNMRNRRLQDVYFLPAAGLVIEPEKWPASAPIVSATFYLEGLPFAGRINAEMLRRYQDWAAQQSAELRPPG
jgi:hypothetical protein